MGNDFENGLRVYGESGFRRKRARDLKSGPKVEEGMKNLTAGFEGH